MTKRQRHFTERQTTFWALPSRRWLAGYTVPETNKTVALLTTAASRCQDAAGWRSQTAANSGMTGEIRGSILICPRWFTSRSNTAHNQQPGFAKLVWNSCSASPMKLRNWLPPRGATRLLRSSLWRWSHQADESHTGPTDAGISSFLFHHPGDDGWPLEPSTWWHYNFLGQLAWLGARDHVWQSDLRSCPRCSGTRQFRILFYLCLL